MLKEKNVSENLPSGWYFNGNYYVDVEGNKKFEHPNLELLIKNYIDEQNSIIGDFNREV